MTKRDSLPELTRLQQERVACAFLTEGCMLETVPSSNSLFYCQLSRIKFHTLSTHCLVLFGSTTLLTCLIQRSPYIKDVF